MLALGAFSGDDERDVGQSRHGMQQLVQTFFGGEAAEIEDVTFFWNEIFFRGQCLEVRQDCNQLSGKTSADQLVAHKFGGREEQIDATLVRPQPTMEICFGGENYGTGAR